MPHSQIAYGTKQLWHKKFFDSMFSLESDKMTALLPNDSLKVKIFQGQSKGQ